MADSIGTGFSQFSCAHVQMRYSIGEDAIQRRSHSQGLKNAVIDADNSMFTSSIEVYDFIIETEYLFM